MTTPGYLKRLFRTSSLHRPVHDRRGAVAVIAALSVPLMVAGLAIGVDVAYWRYRQASLQIAADAVAMSLAIDIGNNIRSQDTLLNNARSEGQKLGCITNCTVSVVYPLGGDSTAVRVVMTDTNASRFFSTIYTTARKELIGTAAARSQAADNTTTRRGSGCILALDPTAAYAIRLDGSTPRTIVQGCEVIANSNHASAILVQGASTINAMATSVGKNPGVHVLNGGVVTNPNPGRAATPDPYLTRFNATGSVFRGDQFRRPYDSRNGFYQSECIEYVASIASGGGGTPGNIAWDRDLRTISTTDSQDVQRGIPDLASRNYSSYIAADGRRVHNLGGGGGRFCQNLSVQNIILNLGPGVWFFNGDTTFNNVAINATGNSMASINAMIPTATGQMTNGITLLRGGRNFAIQNKSEFHLRAPTIGPYAGIAVGTHTESASRGTNGLYSFTLATDVTLEWSGALYLPYSPLLSQGNAGLITLAGPDGTAATGCSQIIAKTIMLSHRTYTGNTCGGYGVAAWGNDASTGWISGSGTAGGGVGGRLIAD